MLMRKVFFSRKVCATKSSWLGVSWGHSRETRNPEGPNVIVVRITASNIRIVRNEDMPKAQERNL